MESNQEEKKPAVQPKKTATKPSKKTYMVGKTKVEYN